jgi:hypothetical protein
METPNYEFDPEALNELWNSVSEVRERYGMLTGGALLTCLRDLVFVCQERSDMLLRIEQLEEMLLLANEAHDDLLQQKATDQSHV